MGSKAVAHGPVAKAVAVNVKAIRERRKLSQQGLADRMAQVGRPMLASAVAKVEAGARRVDADDLIALALALNVTPSRLLLQDSTTDNEAVALTPTFGVASWRAWEWASGEQAIDVDDDPGEDLGVLVPHGSGFQTQWSPKVMQRDADFTNERPIWMRAPQDQLLAQFMRDLRWSFVMALACLPGRGRFKNDSARAERLSHWLKSIERKATAVAREAKRYREEIITDGND